MSLIHDLVIAIKNINIIQIEKILDQLQNYSPSKEDDAAISELKESIMSLLDHADKNDDLFNVNHVYYEPFDVNYTMNKNKLFTGLIKLPFITDDVKFLQKTYYQAYAKENASIYCIVMQALFEHYRSIVGFSEEDVKNKEYKVPHVFHYIWLGKTMPDHLVSNLMSMISVAKKGNYEICLWTDNASKQEAIFNEIPPLHRKYVKIKLIDELNPKIDTLFSNVLPEHKSTAANVIKGFVAQEMEGFKNYAAASDLLRLMILYIHGGIYMDADIKLKFDSKREIGDLNDQLGFKQLMKIWRTMPGLPEIIQERNDMLMAAPGHPVLREAIKIWFKLLSEERSNVLPHDINKKSKFEPTFADQRRYGESRYEERARKDPIKGQFKPKELGTGNLGVLPITFSLQEYIQKFNTVNKVNKTQKDFAFRYNRKAQMVKDKFKINSEIGLGNLTFDHVMEHAWLSDKKKKSIDM